MSQVSVSPAAIVPSYCRIHKLPDELLSKILVAVVHPVSSGGLVWSERSAWQSNFPALAQLICDRWKAVALTTPALWSILDFRVIRNPKFPLLLTRSGALPLQVCVDLPRDIGDDQSRRSRQNLQLVLREHGTRISQFCLRGQGHMEIRQIVNNLPPNMTSLSKLAVDGVVSSNGTPMTVLPLTTPNLRSLTVKSCSLDWTKMAIYTNLEYLYVVEGAAVPVPVDAFFIVLQGCTNLRELRLENQSLDGGKNNRSWDAHQTFVLDKLEKLTLRRFFLREMRTIFSLVGVPNLKGFTGRGVYNGTETGDGGQLKLHAPLLERLVLEGTAGSLEIGRSVPQVKRLTLVPTEWLDYNAMDKVFEMLRSFWLSLADPLPLEILKVEGIRLTSLLFLLECGQRTVVPQLSKIVVHYADVFCSRNSKEFEERAGEWSKLSSLVETEVFGVPTKAIDARASVTLWEEELEWRKTWLC